MLRMVSSQGKQQFFCKIFYDKKFLTRLNILNYMDIWSFKSKKNLYKFCAKDFPIIVWVCLEIAKM